MKIVTAAEMRELDRQTIEWDGVPQAVLMERAGKGVADAIRHFFPNPCRVVCMVGKGNNGGDAQVAARLLEAAGYWCTLCPTFDAEAFDAADVIIDGLLGTGTRHPLSTELTAFITAVNATQKPVIAIDIPSGLDADTGTSCGAIIQAVCTATMGLPKLGLYLGEGPNCSGEVRVVDIGISAERLKSPALRREWVDAHLVSPYFPPRDKTAHKGDFGHVLVIAGSTGKIGAGFLAARGALRSGAGLATYALPKEAFQKFDPDFAEIMIEELTVGKISTLLQKKSAVIIGPGMGASDQTSAILTAVLKQATIPVVCDADALNTMAEHPNLLELLSDRCVLTPHPGEMGRLTHAATAEVQSRRLAMAEAFSQNHPAVLVLKGAATITSAADHSWVNPTGNPAMASAGMGDVLAGVIGGLLAQGLPVPAAAFCGVYLHGLAGDLAAQTMPQGLLASDVAERIPAAIHQVQS